MKSPKQNGQKSVGTKPTALEMEQRITEVEMLLSLGARRTQIHATIGGKYAVDWRTVDRYVSRARSNLIKRTEKSKSEHQNDSLNFYSAIALNPSASAGERIRARQRIDELLGLDAPRQVRTELTGASGGPIATKDETPLPSLSKERLRELIAMAEAGGNGHGGNGNGEAKAERVGDLQG